MDLNTEIGNFERASVGSVVKTTLIDLLNKIGGTDPVKNTLGLGGKNHSDYELKLLYKLKPHLSMQMQNQQKDIRMAIMLLLEDCILLLETLVSGIRRMRLNGRYFNLYKCNLIRQRW